MINTAKQHLARNVAVYVFEVLYFLTTVAGNIAFLTPAGSEWPALFINDFSWSSFGISFGAAYWALVFMPLVLVPLIATGTRRAARPLAIPLTSWLSEIRWPIYVILAAALLGYAFYALDEADAFERMTEAQGALGAVAARYAILGSLGFVPQIVLMSLLVFLSIYAIVRSAWGKGWLWSATALTASAMTGICLILLNMKWPVVVFLLLIAACVFVVSKRYAILKTIAALGLATAVYLLISVVILRLAPVPTPAPSHQIEVSHPAVEASSSPPNSSTASATREIEINEHSAKATAGAAISHAPRLMVVALTRMAQAMPYYYAVFTEQGHVCGTIIDRIERKPSPCQPSNFIYDRMFPGDRFNGTAPAAVNFYGYALNGWPGAIIETLLAGILLGLFGALWGPAQSRPIIMASYVMGAYAAYFLTQVPIEAAFIYSHGLVWWAGLVLLISAASLPIGFVRRLAP